MSQIFQFLPPKFARSGSLERRLAAALAKPLDDVLATIGTISAYFSAYGAPAEWLDWLMSVASLPNDRALSEQQKRNLIAVGWQIWPKKGNRESIELWVRALVGVTATVTANETAFVVGWSKIGDTVGPGELGFTFTITVPAGSIPEADLRRLLVHVVPGSDTYNVVFA